MDQNSQMLFGSISITYDLLPWPTLILMLFLSSLDNLLWDPYNIFKDADNFEIEYKHANFGVGGVVSP